MPILSLGAGLAFIAVALGAFGAHGLDNRLTAEGKDWWSTATFYALSHAIVVAGLGMGQKLGLAGLQTPALIMSVGILIFSGTLFSMALGAPRWFGAITPIGGVFLLIAWSLLVWKGLQSGN